MHVGSWRGCSTRERRGGRSAVARASPYADPRRARRARVPRHHPVAGRQRGRRPDRAGGARAPRPLAHRLAAARGRHVRRRVHPVLHRRRAARPGRRPVLAPLADARRRPRTRGAAHRAGARRRRRHAAVGALRAAAGRRALHPAVRLRAGGDDARGARRRRARGHRHGPDPGAQPGEPGDRPRPRRPHRAAGRTASRPGARRRVVPRVVRPARGLPQAATGTARVDAVVRRAPRRPRTRLDRADGRPLPTRARAARLGDGAPARRARRRWDWPTCASRATPTPGAASSWRRS